MGAGWWALTASRAYGRWLAKGEREDQRRKAAKAAVARAQTVAAAQQGVMDLVVASREAHEAWLEIVTKQAPMLRWVASELSARGVDASSYTELMRAERAAQAAASKQERLLPHGSVAAIATLGERALAGRALALQEHGIEWTRQMQRWMELMRELYETADQADLEPPEDLTAMPVGASRSAGLPARMSQRWLEEHFPAMGAAALADLLETLRARGWTDDEIATRVRPLIAPRTARSASPR